MIKPDLSFYAYLASFSIMKMHNLNYLNFKAIGYPYDRFLEELRTKPGLKLKIKEIVKELSKGIH